MLSVQYHNYIIHTQRYTTSIKMHQTDSLIPRPPLFTSVCVQYDTRKRKSGEKNFFTTPLVNQFTDYILKLKMLQQCFDLHTTERIAHVH